MFNRRLDRDTPRPIAVAVSGGGDSMAALTAAADWARAAGRPLLVLSVDHRLQEESGRWTAFVGEAAARLGADFRALAWTGPRPAAGVPAAARAARHRLLAQAAGEAGASVIVTGHTASDARENALLGQGALEEWSPSPVWPQGRGVFLLRPLLAQSRAAIRAALDEADVRSIDDPANDDPCHPRVRARLMTTATPTPAPAPLAGDLARKAAILPGGALRFDRTAMLQAHPPVARRVLAAALTSAGGGERPARAAGVDRLLTCLRAAEPVDATLAGARLHAGDEAVIVVRNVGERRRTGAGPLALVPGEAAVWDGRFLVEAAGAGLGLDHLQGHAAGLPAEQRTALGALPAILRPALPVVLGPEGPRCPILEQKSPLARATCLVPMRFMAACGAIAQESELAQGAHGAMGTAVLCSTPVTE